MPYASAPVVSHYAQISRNIKMLRHFDDVQRHGALGIILVILTASPAC